MHFDIPLPLKPSEAFIGILAERNDRFSDWTDRTYHRADQTLDFLHASAPLPGFDESLFQTPLSPQAVSQTWSHLGLRFPKLSRLSTRSGKNRIGVRVLE